MDRCDLDHDGKIDYSEFIQAAINHQSLLNEKNIKAVFQIFDLDKDGYISVKELKQSFYLKSNILLNIPHNDESFIQNIMREVDKNRDNFISFEEFNGALTTILIDHHKEI